MWVKYTDYCENVSKLAYNTLKKKRSIYSCYLSNLNNKKITSLTKKEIADFIINLQASDKQKNYSLIILRSFLSWCVSQEIIQINPASNISSIKTTKAEMKYWSIEQFQKFMTYINTLDDEQAIRTKILVLIELNLGDRIGETRALTWDDINKEHSTIDIVHSFNSDPKTKDYLKTTKNYQSQRVVDVSNKLIESLENYKKYLESKYRSLSPMIFWNYRLHKPYSDTALRKVFYKYCYEAQVPKIRMYDLRHTYVALMMNEGWELYHISKRIGHKNYATTVDKYGHLESKVRKEIAKTTDKYF